MGAIETREIIENYLKKSEEIDYSVRLPETELDVMKSVWNLKPPITTSMLMKEIGESRGWRAPTLISFLNRLEARGFVISYKNGKVRYYIPVADRSEYMSKIAQEFIDNHYSGSLTDFLDSLYCERNIDNDIDELIKWLKMRYRG